MILKGIGKLYHKMTILYGAYRSDYVLENDPTFTYQELCLYRYLRMINTCTDEIDTDNIPGKLEEWNNDFIAHFISPPVFDKPWDEVVVDRRDRPANTYLLNPDSENWWEIGEYAFWFNVSPLREIKFELEEEEKKRVEEAIKEWEAQKAKRRDYQRARRARIKAEKAKK